jgi:phosphatidylglycerophosphatase A
MPEPTARPPTATRLGLAIATCGGIGYLRPASGTWATAATLAAAWCVWRWWLPPDQWATLAAAAVASCLCLASAPAAMRASGLKDPSLMVMDEVAGALLAVAVLPNALVAAQPTATAIIAGLSFRILDIGKPWPMNALERLPGGYGILLDDLAAGLLAGMLTLAAFP